ncbi:MAG: hypothetical protein SF187_02905 [Deltaproteobacteria bacterium]|nr:hypothetical protein [Deltaproteobacteria bacterium]
MASVGLQWILIPSPGWCGKPDAARNLQAEALFVEGRNLLKSDKIAEACEKFAASQSLDPAVGTLLNLADCHERINKTASAWAEFREAADLAGASQDNKRKRLAASRANALATKLARVRITATAANLPKDVVIRVDNDELPPAAWNTDLPIDPGVHTVVAKAAGFVDWTGQVVAEPAKVQEITVGLLQTSAVQPVPTREAEPPVSETHSANVQTQTRPPLTYEQSPNHTALWVGGSITAASVVFGSVAGLIAYKRWDGVSAQCRENGDCTSDERDRGDGAKSWGTLSTLAFTAAGVAAAVTGVLWLTSTPKKESTVAVAPWLQDAGGGAALFGRF